MKMNQITENKMQKIDANSAEAQSADVKAANIKQLIVVLRKTIAHFRL